MHDRLFDPAQSHLLEDPARLRFMPQSEVINALGLASGMTVADIGAGTGYFAIPVAKAIAPGGRVFAVDVQRDMLLRLDAKLRHAGASGNISLVEGDATRTSLSDASCDRILIANVWHELEPEARTAALQEFARILRSGGRLALLDWRADVPARTGSRPRTKNDPPGPPAEHRVPAAQAANDLRAHGWMPGLEKNVGDFSYLIVASRL